MDQQISSIGFFGVRTLSIGLKFEFFTLTINTTNFNRKISRKFLQFFDQFSNDHNCPSIYRAALSLCFRLPQNCGLSAVCAQSYFKILNLVSLVTSSTFDDSYSLFGRCYNGNWGSIESVEHMFARQVT